MEKSGEKMPKKIYSLYHKIEDFTFSMPGGWDDYTISVFLEACHKYVEDLRNYAGDFMRQWSRIVGYGLAMTSNLNCFNITVTMELAKVLKAYLLKNENTQQYVTNLAFRNLLDDTKDLLAYFPNAIESQIAAPTHSRNCDCLPLDNREPISVIHVIKHVSKQYRHLFGAKGIPASILWTEISQKVSDKTGTKVDVKQFLEPIKIEIALKVRKEIDSEMRTKKFLALAKDYLAYFDYIPPRSIKKSDFLPPELLDVIVEHEYECKTDDAETTEDTNQITCNNSEDFMDVDYVGAYCEIPYNEEAKSNHSNSNSEDTSDNGNPNDTISSEENNEDEEESVCSFMDINSRIDFESVRVEKCEEILCKNLTRYADPEDCILDNVANGNENSNYENETSHVMKSFNNFQESFQERSEKGDTLLYKQFQNSTDNISNSDKSYRLPVEDNIYERSLNDQESYCMPPSVMNKYATVKNDNACNKLADGTQSYKTKDNLCEYINNTIEPTLMQNKTGSDICNALNSMQLLPVSSDTTAITDEHESCKVTNYSDWDNNIRAINNAGDEIKDGFIRRIAENFGLDNLQYDQSRNKSGSSAVHLQKTNCDHIDVFINKDLIEKSSNVLRSIYDGSKFNEHLLRDTSEEVYSLNGPESGDVFSSSSNNSEKIADSLESLISASRNSSPLTVPESIQNLMIEDINSNEICDDGLFKRTMTDIQETSSNIKEHVENPLKEDCTVVQNSSESSFSEVDDKRGDYKYESKNGHLKVNKHKLPRRAKSVDNILHECIKELDNEQSNNKCIGAHCNKCSFLKELQEIFDKKLRENVNPHINANDINEAHEINCKSQNAATSKEFGTVNEIGAQTDVNSTIQPAPTQELNASSSEFNNSLVDDFSKTTLRSSILHHGNEESDKLNSFVNLSETIVYEGKQIEQGISEHETQNTSERNVSEEKLHEQGVSKHEIQNLSETNVSEEKQLEQSPSEYEDRSITDIACTCKENIGQSIRKRRLSERRMSISTPLLFKKNLLLYKKKIKLFKRLRSQRKRYNDNVHPFIIEEAKMKKLYNLDRNTEEQKIVETSDSKDSQSNRQEIQDCDTAEIKSVAAENVLRDTEDKPLPYKRNYQEDNSSSDDSDTPFYGFRTCNPTRRFKKRKFKHINFNRSDNVGAVLVNNHVVILKKAVVLVRDFIQDISQSLETNPKRHICLCTCAKLKEQIGNSTSENRLTPTHEFNSEDSSRKLNAEVSENVPNDRKYLNQTDVLSSSNSVIGEVRDNVENHKRNTLKLRSKENIPEKNIATWERLAEAVKMLQYYGKNELSASKTLRELMENEQEFEMGFDTVFDSVTEFMYRTKRKPCSWYKKFVTEYRNHLTWKTQIKWKMEKEVQGVEKNKTLIMDKLLKLLPKINVD